MHPWKEEAITVEPSTNAAPSNFKQTGLAATLVSPQDSRNTDTTLSAAVRSWHGTETFLKPDRDVSLTDDSEDVIGICPISLQNARRKSGKTPVNGTYLRPPRPIV